MKTKSPRSAQKNGAPVVKRQGGNGNGGNGNGGNGNANADGRNGTAAPPVIVAPHLEVRQSSIHGLGLFAAKIIREGALIGEYEGPRTQRNGSHVLWVEKDDGSVYGVNGRNFLRYVNHSVRPNAEFQGEELLATRTIRRGEEITHHYGDDWD